MKRNKSTSEAMNKTNNGLGVLKRNLADVETMRQETLIQLLFSVRFSGALWIGGSHKSEAIAIELNRLVWDLTRTFPGDIKKVCFEELVNLWNLIRYAQLLKLLAEKLIWDVLPKQTNDCPRGRLLSRYNIDPNCKYISDMACASGPLSLAEVAREEWAHLNGLSQQVKQIQNESPEIITGKALCIMAEVDEMLSCIEGWESGLKRCSNCLEKILDAHSTDTDEIKLDPTLEDVYQLQLHLNDKIGRMRCDEDSIGITLADTRETTRKTYERVEILPTKGDVQEEGEKYGRKMELALARLTRDKHNADADTVKVEAFLRYEKELKDAAGSDNQDGQIAIMRGVLAEMETEGYTVSFHGRKGVEYYNEWNLKLGRPQTGEAYAKAKKEAQKKGSKKKEGKKGVEKEARKKG